MPYSRVILSRSFFRRLQNASTSGVRSMFAKAILSFYRFLQENIGTAAGSDRINGIQQAVALAEREVNRLKNENEMLSTFSGISAERRLQELERYCAVRAIVKSKRIDERVAYMVQAFNENGSINHYNYNYVMGAIMAYLVHCNAARNELCYKTRYGNMCGSGEGCSGLEPVEHRHVLRSEQFWVGRYPLPKHHHRVREPTS
ncbi:hypothetical protein COOONC_11805, partial [Cooperia oncophora]